MIHPSRHAPSTLRALRPCVPMLLTLACDPNPGPSVAGGTRGRRAAAAAASGQAGGGSSVQSGAKADSEADPADGAPTRVLAAPDEDPDAQAEAYAMDPPGTRATNVRCQSAPPEHNLRFMSAWYTYSDKDSPGNTTKGCEIGMSESILEVLPYDDIDISRCAIGWEAKVLPGSAYPFAGMGVRMRDNDLTDVTHIQIETRSTGAPVSLRAQLIMRAQELMQCGDERAANFGATLTCDGTGAWKPQTLDLSKLQATWGKPAPLDLHDITALHFQTLAGFEGALDCDIRIVDVISTQPG